MSTVVRIEGLVKRFGEKLVLDDVYLDITESEFVSVVGHSGCGKSTLLNCMAGLESFDGSITVSGRPVTRGAAMCGVVFQDYALFPWLSAEQNVRFGLRFLARRIDKKDADERIDRLLSMMGLEDARKLYPHQLSGGMRQRVAIARSLAIDPPILLMDEPFASLDALTRRRLGTEVIKVWQETGKVIVFVTHNATEAVMLSDRVLVLHGGRIRHIERVDVARPRSLAQKAVGEKAEAIEEMLAALQQQWSPEPGGTVEARAGARHGGIRRG